MITTVLLPVEMPFSLDYNNQWCVVWCFPWLNSSPPSAAYMRQWIGSALVQIMACRLFGAKPLSKPMLGNCQLNPYGHTSVKFQSKYIFFSFTKMHLKISSAKLAAILSRGRWVKHVNATYHGLVHSPAWYPSSNFVDFYIFVTLPSV